MSQKAGRKSVTSEEKEKTDTPVKEMKKKMAVNAEKEKQAAEKKDAEKPVDKTAEKNEKAAEKEKKTEKPAEKKTEKAVEKKTDKVAEKKADAPVEKKEDSKDDKSAKSDKAEPKKADPKPKLNGKETRGVNGTANGAEENGTVSAADDDDDDDVTLVIDDHDDMFPELTYDDTSDPEFEPPTPEAACSRSFTRRSQAKTTRTPETPRPASDKQADKETVDDSKDSKVLKLKEDAPVSTDRKLRSADSPKPQDKKQEKKQDPKDGQDEAKEQEKENGEKEKEVDVVIEIDGDDEPRKTDTNYSKSRVKVSPYRRSMRLADQTTSSVMANYTGNNTTMEMDITETTSSFLSEDASLDDSSYLSGLRSIRGRRSYKPLKEMTLRRVVNAQPRSLNASATEQPSRPTAPVVGRKRKPEGDSSVELGAEATESFTAAHGKRMRLLDRLTHTFRRTASTPLPARRNAEIVGINTDLPLTAPVAQPDILDPEALKPAAAVVAPAPLPSMPSLPDDRDAKRCVVM